MNPCQVGQIHTYLQTSTTSQDGDNLSGRRVVGAAISDHGPHHHSNSPTESLDPESGDDGKTI